MGRWTGWSHEYQCRSGAHRTADTGAVHAGGAGFFIHSDSWVEQGSGGSVLPGPDCGSASGGGLGAHLCSGRWPDNGTGGGFWTGAGRCDWHRNIGLAQQGAGFCARNRKYFRAGLRTGCGTQTGSTLGFRHGTARFFGGEPNGRRIQRPIKGADPSSGGRAVLRCFGRPECQCAFGAERSATPWNKAPRHSRSGPKSDRGVDRAPVQGAFYDATGQPVLQPGRGAYQQSSPSSVDCPTGGPFECQCLRAQPLGGWRTFRQSAPFFGNRSSATADLRSTFRADVRSSRGAWHRTDRIPFLGQCVPAACGVDRGACHRPGESDGHQCPAGPYGTPSAGSRHKAGRSPQPLPDGKPLNRPACLFFKHTGLCSAIGAGGRPRFGAVALHSRGGACRPQNSSRPEPQHSKPTATRFCSDQCLELGPDRRTNDSAAPGAHNPAVGRVHHSAGARFFDGADRRVFRGAGARLQPPVSFQSSDQTSPVACHVFSGRAEHKPTGLPDPVANCRVDDLPAWGGYRADRSIFLLRRLGADHEPDPSVLGQPTGPVDFHPNRSPDNLAGQSAWIGSSCVLFLRPTAGAFHLCCRQFEQRSNQGADEPDTGRAYACSVFGSFGRADCSAERTPDFMSGHGPAWRSEQCPDPGAVNLSGRLAHETPDFRLILKCD